MATGAVLTTKDIFKLIDTELAAVECELQKQSDSNVSLVDAINRYVHSSGGKRLRPALLLLCSKSAGYEGPASIELGVVVELIHVATLVHDDIIDNASLRRSRPSVNAVWGNAVTVLMGDWLYMTSFRMALDLKDYRILQLLIDITRKMVEGELMQLDQNGRTDVSVAEQLEICNRKTAFLFAGCARLGGMLGKVGPALEERLEAYGRSLGMAFQLIDDLLDYTSSEQILGKPVLKDLEEGRITLPIIYLLERAATSEKELVRRIIEERDFTSENKQQIIRLVNHYKTADQLRRLAEGYAAEAKEAISAFPDSIYKEALARIPEFVTSRES